MSVERPMKSFDRRSSEAVVLVVLLLESDLRSELLLGRWYL